MDTLKLIATIIGFITGISGMIMGIFGFLFNRFQAINTYFSIDNDAEFLKARKKLYNSKPECIPVKSIEAALVCNYFNYWVLMTKKHYLPFWIFKSAPGISLVRLYDILTPNIIEKRCNNPLYAEHYEWLCGKIKKYHVKKKSFFTMLKFEKPKTPFLLIMKHPQNGLSVDWLENETDMCLKIGEMSLKDYHVLQKAEIKFMRNIEIAGIE